MLALPLLTQDADRSKVLTKTALERLAHSQARSVALAGESICCIATSYWDVFHEVNTKQSLEQSAASYYSRIERWNITWLKVSELTRHVLFSSTYLDLNFCGPWCRRTLMGKPWAPFHIFCFFLPSLQFSETYYMARFTLMCNHKWSAWVAPDHHIKAFRNNLPPPSRDTLCWVKGLKGFADNQDQHVLLLEHYSNRCEGVSSFHYVLQGTNFMPKNLQA